MNREAKNLEQAWADTINDSYGPRRQQQRQTGQDLVLARWSMADGQGRFWSMFKREVGRVARPLLFSRRKARELMALVAEVDDGRSRNS